MTLLSLKQNMNCQKIDVHCHILPKKWPDLKERYGYGGWIRLKHCEKQQQARMEGDDGKFFRLVDRNCWDLDSRLEDMNNDGVALQVLSTVPVMFGYWAKAEDTLDLCRLLNDDLANLTSHKSARFAAFGSLPAQAPELAVQEMKRCVTELGFCGFEIGSHVNDWSLDDARLTPIYKTAEDLDCCLFVHPWDMHTWDGRLSKYWLPWLLGMPAETAQAICSVLMGGVFERHGMLKLLFAHGGGAYPYIQGRVNHGHKVRPDLCASDCPTAPSEFHKRLFVDSLVHDSEALRLLVNCVGQKNVLLGTDYPFPLGDLTPGRFIETDEALDASVKNDILRHNAVRLLKLNGKIESLSTNG